MNPSLPTLAIIIVNWNAGQLLHDCLQSITEAEKTGFTLSQVVIVDNASSDGSLANLNEFALPLTLIRNNVNRGFAYACNQGAQSSAATYLLFLNPDTRLYAHSLDTPIAFMQQTAKQKTGIVGIQLLDDGEKISRSCARFPRGKDFFYQMLGLPQLWPQQFQSHLLATWGHTESRNVDHVIGAFFLVRHELFDQLGGFDERYFVYLEDLDFSLRASKLGYSTYYLATAQAYHKGGGTSEQAKPRRLFYSLQSRILYGYKHFGCWVGSALLLATLFLEPVTRLLWALAKRSRAQAIETVQGYKLLYQSLPSLLKQIKSL